MVLVKVSSGIETKAETQYCGRGGREREREREGERERERGRERERESCMGGGRGMTTESKISVTGWWDD
jgi:hypothetical protein